MLDITVHAPCFNEERMLPHFLKYYNQFAKKIIIYDNMSSDRSIEIIRSYPNTRVLSFDTNGKYSEKTLTNIRNNCWKFDKTDFSIICDIDEIVYAPSMKKFLDENPNFDVYKPIGYQMISTSFPNADRVITDQIKMGVEDQVFSKMAIIRPNRLFSTNYGYGSHSAAPAGRYGQVRIYEAHKNADDLKLLHYKNVGFDYLLERAQSTGQRLGSDTRIHGLGKHYTYDTSRWSDIFGEYLSKASKVIP